MDHWPEPKRPPNRANWAGVGGPHVTTTSTYVARSASTIVLKGNAASWFMLLVGGRPASNAALTPQAANRPGRGVTFLGRSALLP